MSPDGCPEELMRLMRITKLNKLEGFVRFLCEGRRELWVSVWFFQSGEEGGKDVEELKIERRF